MTETPSIYTEEFFVAWDTFAETIHNAFRAADVDQKNRPIAVWQTRHALASLAIATLLKNIGQENIADEFHLMAEALQDLVEGIPHPLFKVERLKDEPGRRGRVANTSAIWRIQSSICLSLQFIISGGVERSIAITGACKLHKKDFSKLLRPGSELLSSVDTWLKKFATDEVSNEIALESYKQGMVHLDFIKSKNPPETLRALGEQLVARAAARAALLP